MIFAHVKTIFVIHFLISGNFYFINNFFLFFNLRSNTDLQKTGQDSLFGETDLIFQRVDSSLGDFTNMFDDSMTR